MTLLGKKTFPNSSLRGVWVTWWQMEQEHLVDVPDLHLSQSSHLLYFISPPLYWKQVCEPFSLPIPNRPLQTISVSVQKFRQLDWLFITDSPSQRLDRRHRRAEIERDIYRSSCPHANHFSATAQSREPCISSFNINICLLSVCMKNFSTKLMLNCCFL